MSVKLSPPLAILMAAALLAAAPLAAAIKLPSVIGDHMVVQRDKPVAVWGWAEPGETITVRLAGGETAVKAGPDGRFEASLPALKSGGGPYEMTVQGGKSPAVVVKDILVGEVWVCSGQSNMEFPLSSTATPIPELLRADQPRLRLYRVPKRISAVPLDNIDASWTLCTPETAGPFSAVGYYFGLELLKTLDVPIGLIGSAWGGTDIEPWTPPAGFAAVPEVKPYLAAAERREADFRQALAGTLPAWQAWIGETKKALAAGASLPAKPAQPVDPFDSPQTPTGLYNGMIHALIRFPVRGAIWYQGENNRNDTLAYEKKMEALILGWREVWKSPDLAFYYVQLAPYYYAYNRDYAGGDIPDFLRLPLVWEAQSNILRLPHTGMAVITDITDLMDIHPRNKRDVGYRLSLWARAKLYGESGLVCSGPLFKSMAVEGAKARIAFDFVGGGLMANDGQSIKWFEIAGEDKIFYRAEAKIEGAAVVVSNPRVAAPKAVRFGWHQMAVPNLANQEGLPASPFRTDRW
ncbi:MAG: sialate O-acetylesterase [Candidatus Aminicenantes bacterium]|nr:sialate O-acetylesterase [Candidatus Aminicenantes bacterium]